MFKTTTLLGFPNGSAVKTGDTDSIPDGKIPREGNGNPL